MPVMPVQAEVITQQALWFTTPDDGPKTIAINGKLGIVYLDSGNAMKFRWASGKDKPITISKQAHPNVRNSFIGAYSMDGNIYVTWRPKTAGKPLKGEKTGDKHVVFSASYDGGKTFSDPVRLDSGTGSFKPTLVSGGKGRIYVFWLDERAGGDKFRVYMNRSGDYGRTWLKRDVRMDRAASSVFEPFTAAFGKDVWIGWIGPSRAKNNKQPVLNIRHSQDDGIKWSNEIVVPTPPGKFYWPRIARTSKGLFMYYYAVGKGIMVSRSEDRGRTWGKYKTISGTEKSGSNGFQLASDGKGDFCLMWPGPFKLEKKKADIYVTCSHDDGMTWDRSPVRLDTNTPRFTHSLNPDIAMDSKGRTVVVWQDSRNIRPDIYLNYTQDGGRHWLEHDIRIQARSGERISQFPSIATTGGGKFLMAWVQALDDTPQTGHVLAYQELMLGKCVKLGTRSACPEKASKAAVDKARKQRLLKRAGEFWKAYVDGDFIGVYDMWDPFIRARVTKKSFAATFGQTDYLDARIEDVTITENFADVKVKVKFEAKHLHIGRMHTSVPPTERDFRERWIWVDGDWFKVFSSRSGDFLPL